MKIGFIVPLLNDYDVEKAYNSIEKACFDCKVDYEVIFAINSNLNGVFTDIRSKYIENSKVKAFMLGSSANEHEIITLAMPMCESYDATIIYSGKEEINVDVVRAFITSWQSGNKIVYLKKVYTGLKKFFHTIKDFFYQLGLKFVGVFKDVMAENDIQLLDQDVVKTINQIPEKNQQLRTLDSFIGYNLDVIHIEINEKEKNDLAYVHKSKQYIVAKSMCIVFLCLTFVGFIISMVGLGIDMGIPIFIHVLLWFIFIFMAVLTFIYNTKRTLALRVGKQLSSSKLNTYKNEMEKYNIQ